jgi:hypothetical protein
MRRNCSCKQQQLLLLLHFGAVKPVCQAHGLFHAKQKQWDFADCLVRNGQTGAAVKMPYLQQNNRGGSSRCVNALTLDI